VISEEAAHSLREAGVVFTLVGMEADLPNPQGAATGERI
jgi:hypothetical protein